MLTCQSFINEPNFIPRKLSNKRSLINQCRIIGQYNFNTMETSANLSSKSNQYYVVAKHWASDLEFFKVESNFFHYLLDKYFIRLSSPEYIEKLKQLGRELRVLEEDRHKTDILVGELLKLIVLIAEDIVPEDLEKIEATQGTLEVLMKELSKKYMETKKELFTTVEKAIKTDNLFDI